MRDPQEIVAYVDQSALAKGQYPLSKVILLGFLGGAFISMGALLSVMIGYGFPVLAAANPALIRLGMGATFPIGLILIVLAGGEIFTGNCAYFIPNIRNHRQSWGIMLRQCSWVWLSNFIGALFFAYFLVYLTHLSSHEPTLGGFLRIAEAKTANPFWVTFLKGVGANWLVCLAMWLGFSATDTTGKILGIWFPVMTFVAIGYEHCVANMFFLPMAMMEGFDLTIGELLTKNLIPATLGNFVGGALFVGLAYWYLYDNQHGVKKK